MEKNLNNIHTNLINTHYIIEKQVKIVTQNPFEIFQIKLMADISKIMCISKEYLQPIGEKNIIIDI